MDHSNHIDHADMHMSTSMPMGMHMEHMKMYFHFGSSETVLFDFWKTTNARGIIWSSIVIFLLCFIYEGVKWIRTYLRKRELGSELQLPDGVPRQRKLTVGMFVDGGLHAVQLFLGYSLMLVFMTFNIWLCIATVFGEVVAHLFFRFLYPDLDRFNLAAREETCCG